MAETIQDKLTANSLYLSLGKKMEEHELRDVKVLLRGVIKPAELETCGGFADICHSLENKGLIKPKDHSILATVFENIGRNDLQEKVNRHDTKLNENTGVCLPLTSLYNQNARLPTEQKLEEFLNVLDISLGPDAIPQQLFYPNAAAGIARPDRDLTLELGKELSLNLPKGAVTKEKIIYCHFVETLPHHLVACDELPVFYSIPVMLGPPGEVFNPEQNILLRIAHNAVTSVSQTVNLRLFVRKSQNDAIWSEKEGHFCIIDNQKATVLLKHFSEFMIGIHPSTTISLPLLRSRALIYVKCIGKTVRILGLCLLFDSPYMIKKSVELIRQRKQVTVVTVGQETLLHPKCLCNIQIEPAKWKPSKQIKGVTQDELSMLVFNPIIRVIRMVENPACTQSENMCGISLQQNEHYQKFFVTNNTLELVKGDTEDLEMPESRLGPLAVMNVYYKFHEEMEWAEPDDLLQKQAKKINQSFDLLRAGFNRFN